MHRLLLCDLVGLLGSANRLAMIVVVVIVVDEAQAGTEEGDGVEGQRCGLVRCGSLDLDLDLLFLLCNLLILLI